MLCLGLGFETRLAVDEVGDFGCENEWISLTFITKLFFFIFQKVAKVNVKEITLNVVNHNVVWMPIT
jgi:hypothetical protein